MLPLYKCLQEDGLRTAVLEWRRGSGYTVETVIADLNTRLDDTPNEEVVLVGHSSGGYIAQRLENARDDVVGLILLASSVDLPLLNGIAPQAMRLIPHILPGRKKRFIPSERAVEVLLSKRTNREDLVPEHPRIFQRLLLASRRVRPSGCPTLVLWGEEDKIHPPFLGRYLAWKHQAILKTCRGMDHMLPNEKRVAWDIVLWPWLRGYELSN